MTKQLKNVVTAAEINEFLYDPFFKNDVRSLLHFMEVVAESQFVPLEHVCVGVGYRESEQKNRSSFLYLHNPETNCIFLHKHTTYSCSYHTSRSYS